jgi:hypothetical protein
MGRCSRRRTWSAAVALAATVVAALAATAAPGTAGTAAAGCGDPVVHDRYDGFHVGVPAGWNLSIQGGFIVVQKDPAGTIESVVDPAVLRKGQSPTAFLKAALALLGKGVRQAGSSMSYRLTGARTATITGKAGTTPTSGSATVRVVPLRTAHGTAIAVFSAYWAPTGQMGGYKRSLAAVGGCYGPEAGTLFRIFRDQAFTYPLPPGWTPHEGVDQMFIDDGPDASANYVFAQAIPASDGVTDVGSFLRFMLGKLGVSIGTVLASGTTPPQTTTGGGTAQFEQMNFLGTVGSKQVHGIVGATATSGGGVTSGAIRLAIATTALWNSVNPALLRVVAGIQHDFTQDDQELLKVQQQIQGFQRQVEGFDQALNGTDIVHDPATGQTYEAPYSAYSKSGPQGAGYYIDQGGIPKKLQILTPGG